ncbi:MAG TPA: hypothetical protein VIN11_09070, partial [Roseivirga sp.]
MKKIINIFLITILVGFTACEYEFPTPPEEVVQSAQNADLTKISFIGGTRFAGLMDGGYTANSVQYSIPNLMLQNGNFIEADATVTPAVSITSGFNVFENATLTGTTGAYKLFYPTADTTQFKRTILDGESLQFENAGSTNLQAYAFPGLGLLDITEANTSNIYESAFFTNQSSSLATQIAQSSSTFFVLDAGYEDLLNFSLNGAAGNSSLNDANIFTRGDLLSETLFRSKLEALTNQLLNSDPNAKGVLLNIPNFLQFPIFSKVRYDLTPFIDRTIYVSSARSQAASFNSKVLAYNTQNPNTPAADRRPLFDFASDNRGNWGIVIEDPTLADVTYNGEDIPKIRHAKVNEYFIYQNENALRTGYGSQLDEPVPNNKFITNAEEAIINQKIAAYNAIITDVAANSNGRLIVADTKALFDQLFTGYDRFLGNSPEGTTINGVFYEPLISDFGMFSTDGLNLNPAGNAILSNTIVNAINNGFGGNLKGINPNELPGTEFS